MSFNWDLFRRDCYRLYILAKFSACKVLACVVDNRFWGPNIDVNPACPNCLPYRLCKHAAEESGGLKNYYWINNIEDWLALEIYNINNNLCIELEVNISDVELEPARGFAVNLALVAKLRDIFDNTGVKFLICSVQEVNQATSRWMPKTSVKLT